MTKNTFAVAFVLTAPVVFSQQQPGDTATQTLSHPSNSQAAFLSANPGWQPTSTQPNAIFLKDPTGKKGSAILGNVTYQDSTTGAWTPNDPTLSATGNGWRIDGTAYAVFIRKSGATQHVVSQTYTEYAGKHASTLNFTVPTLTYSNGFKYGFTQDGLAWNLIFTSQGTFQIRSVVSKRIGKATHSFPVTASEPLTVDSLGELIGDAHIGLTRAVMIPRFGKPIQCSAWSYSNGQATFNCDDTALKADQFPYIIDPQSTTLTDGGTYNIDNWNDGQGDSGSDNATVNFSLSGLSSDSLITGLGCNYNILGDSMDGGDSEQCSISSSPPYSPQSTNGASNSATVTLTISVNNSDSSWGDSSTINDVQLVVDYQGFSPSPGTYSSAPQVNLPTIGFLSFSAGENVAWTAEASNYSWASGYSSGSCCYMTAIITLAASTSITAANGPSSSPYSYSSGSYTVQSPVSTPTFSPAAGTYTSTQSVSISTSTSGATIRYTTDGSTPTEAHGTVYSGAISVSSTETLKAIAYKSGLTDSSVASATYTITGTVATPTFSPAAGTYTSAQSVTLSTSTSGATIRYTTNGSTPTATTGTVYSGAFTVSSTQTVQAIAYESGWATSAVASATYTITGTVAAPTFSPAAGTYTSAQSVVLSTTTPSATIRYTTDGSTPTEIHGTVYSGAIGVSATETVAAISYESGWIDSAVVSAAYTITGTVATPTFSPAAGIYTSAQSVTLTTTTSGATIRYTTDGSTPTETHGTVYSAAIAVSATETVTAIAYETAWADSAVASAAYTITGTVATPAISPAAGTYTTAQSVTLSTSTSGATIRYTTDGTTPTETHGTIYSAAISVSATETVAAIAYETNWADSAVASAPYTIIGAVATPTFNPSAGIYTTAQSVSLSTTTSGATIRYTTDGTTPTETHGTVYSGAITVSATATIEAIAYESGFTDSAVTSGYFQIAPTIPPAITNMALAPATNGLTATIAGSNLGTAQSGTMTINGLTASPISWTPSSIVTPVPAAATSGNVIVTVSGVASAPAGLPLPPVITGVTPGEASPPQSVTISGNYFGDTQGSNSVTLNGSPLTPSSWSAGSIAVTVPIGAQSGVVIVTVNGVASNGFPIIVLAPALTVSTSTVGNLAQGFDYYSITVTNAGSASANGANGTPNGPVTVNNVFPATNPPPITGNYIQGYGWTCTQPSGPCTRSDVLPPNSPGWYNPSWSYRKQITIGQGHVSGSASLTNFPVLISLFLPASSVQLNGADILFTDSTGIVKLNHEMELYIPVTGQLIAWVQAPSLSPSADNTIYMYYGNPAAASQQAPAAVWDSTFNSVYHLPSPPPFTGSTLTDNYLSANDSTGTANNGTIHGTLPTSGEIGGGANFGALNYIGAGQAINSDAFTISAWIYPTRGPDMCQGSGIFYQGTGNSYGGTRLTYDGNCSGWNNTLGFSYENGAPVGANSNIIQLNTWQHIAATYNAGTVTFYANGVVQGSATGLGAQATAANPSAIGFWYNATDGTRFFDGSIDEVEISGVARTAGWIATEYNNQNSPGTFYSVGEQEVPSGGVSSYPPIAVEINVAASAPSPLTYTVQVSGGGSASSSTTSSTVLPTVAPGFSIPFGTYSTTQQVSLGSPTPGAVIRYTTDGTTPTQNYGTIYSPGSLITVNATETIMAIAYAPGYLPSGANGATYTLTPVVTSVTVGPAPIMSGANLTITATLSMPAPSAAVVSLTSTNEAALNLPPGTTITVPAGQLTASTTQFNAGTGGSVTVTGTYNGTSQAWTGAVVAPNFTISLSAPTPATVIAGTSANYTVSVNPVAGTGFNSSVSLVAVGLPAGAAATFNPSTLSAASIASGAATSMMTVISPVSFTAAVTGTAATVNGTLTNTATAAGPLNVQDFVLTATPSSSTASPLLVNAGQVVNFTVSATGLNNYSTPVNISLSLPQICGNCYSQTTSEGVVTPGSSSTPGSITFQWAVPSYTLGGNYAYSISGTAPGLTHSVTGFVTVAPQDFTVSLVQSPVQTVYAPGSGNFIATLTSINNFAGIVYIVNWPSNWTATLPNGSTVGVVPVTLTAGATIAAPFILNFPSNGLRSGQNVFTIEAQGNGVTHSTNCWITASATPGSILSVTSSHSGSFTVGQPGSYYTLTVTNQAGAGATSGNVSVTDNLPAGLALSSSMSGSGWSCGGNTCTRSDSLSGGASYPPITAAVTVGLNAPPQVYNQATVTGNNAQTATATDPTTIQGSSSPPDFTLTVSPNPIVVAPGGIATYQISVTPLGGFGNTAVSLNNIGAIAGATASPMNPSSVQYGSSATFTLTASSAPSYGAIPVLISGTAGPTTHSTIANLQVAPPAPAAIVSPPPGQFIPGGATQFNWNTGLGATQFTLTAGSTPGAADLYLGSAGTSLSASVSLPSTVGQTIYMTLNSSTAAGVALPPQTYPYTIGTQPIPSGLTLASGPVAVVNTNGVETAYTYQFTGGDARTLIACTPTLDAVTIRIIHQTSSTATLGFTPVAGASLQDFDFSCGCGGRGHGGSGDSPVITGISPASIPAPTLGSTLQIQGVYFGDPTDTDNVQICSTTASRCYSIDTGPESDSLIVIDLPVILPDTYMISVITDEGETNQVSFGVSASAPPIYDTPPNITSVMPGDIPALSGQAVAILGTNFGASGNLTISQGASSLPYTISAWNDDPTSSEIDLVVDASTANPGTAYTISLSTTTDALGNAFQSASGPSADSTSANLEIDPAGSYWISGTVTAQNGALLNGIKITANSGASATTGSNGYYTIGPFQTCSNVALSATFLAPYTIPFTANGPAAGFFACLQANQVQNFTANQYTAVYLLHGIGQSNTDMFSLKSSLENGPNGLDLSKFYVDATFTYSECSQTNGASCTPPGATCTITNGAIKLATQYIANAPADIVLVGYSMGGLIARTLLVNGYTAAYGSVLNGRTVHGLVTLGAPNLGYPWLPIDTNVQCAQLTYDLAGSWNTNTGVANPAMSSVIPSVNGSWGTSSYGGYWLAAAGKFCSQQIRYQTNAIIQFNPGQTVIPTGCLERSGINSNDGVGCADSELYADPTQLAPAGNPTATFSDPSLNYSHTKSFLGFGTALMMGCTTGSANKVLYQPQPGDPLYTNIVTVITNGH